MYLLTDADLGPVWVVGAMLIVVALVSLLSRRPTTRRTTRPSAVGRPASAGHAAS